MSTTAKSVSHKSNKIHISIEEIVFHLTKLLDLPAPACLLPSAINLTLLVLFFFFDSLSAAAAIIYLHTLNHAKD